MQCAHPAWNDAGSTKPTCRCWGATVESNGSEVNITLRARALSAGSTVAVVAPSWCGPAVAPHRVERGRDYLERQGYRVVLAPHLFAQDRWAAGKPEQRAQDLMTMFEDPAIDAVWAAIGGDYACHLLPHLDWDLIARNPKVFIGFSDITVINAALHTVTGLVTFNGPSLMNELAEFPAPPEYAMRQLWRVLASPTAARVIEPASEWTEEHLEWTTREDLTRGRTYTTSPGWTWLREGTAEGRLFGGCLESLQHLRGTPYFPAPTALEGALFFWEISEVRPSPEWVDAVLQDYENMDVLSHLGGMLVGRPYGYSDADKVVLREVILERTKRYRFPIVTDMDFGHTSPQMTLPLGCQARIDGDRHTFSINEAAVI